ncbi:putative nucleic acid-binding protein [Paraburkholderia sp. JPY465]|uniref:hypothetical protein n=1 Tax=Paraburkholderia sp. JPY465 TaxID=3042285 RepID=UPI003D19B47B
MNGLEIAHYAARAANWESRRYFVRELEVVHVRPRDVEAARWRLFSPLDSDADAAALAAAARIDVSHHDAYVAAMAGVGPMRIFTHDDIDVDRLPDLDCAERRRATRRAVAECAAFIGRDLGPFWWRTA